MPSLLAIIPGTYRYHVKCIHVKKQPLFLNILVRFWKFHENLNYLIIKLSLITLIFPKLFTPKIVVTEIHSRSCFRTLFGSQRVNGSQTLQKSAREDFYPTFSSF